VDGPTPVIRYRFAREKCALPTVEGGNRLHFTPSAECQKYGTPLSFVVSTIDGTDPETLHVRQGSTRLPAKKLWARWFVVDADPTQGDAVLTK
jgi:hypothetical protein